jgi:nucleotide-binding universal stress UspA family protein
MMSTTLRHQPQPGEGQGYGTMSLPAVARIVVPLDGSQLAERALAWAVALGRAFRAELLLVRALGSSGSLPSGNAGWTQPQARSSERDALPAASVYLARVTSKLRACGVHVTSRLIPLPADEAMREATRHAPADLILLAVEPHASGGRGRSLGRIADRVVQQSEVPVLLTTSLKGSRVLGADQIPAGVLVLLDDALTGASAIAYGLAFAAAFHGGITLVQRAANPMPERLQQASAALVPVETAVLHAEAREEFVEGVSRLPGDLIVWGAPGIPEKLKPAGWAQGAAYLLHSSRKPVLLVP